MNKKVCFISTYIGNINQLDISKEFITVDKYDYFFFTNLNEKDIPNKSWKHIQIDLKDFKHLKNSIFISRYFKFMIHDYFKKTNKDYDFVIYCDSFLNPKSDKNWDEIIEECLNSEFPIIQYNHFYSKSIIDEMLAIIKCEKDSVQNMEKLKKYLENIKEGFNMNKKQFYENTCLGYSLKNEKVLNFLRNFWKYYINNENPSYRDQCLWNFMYINYNKKAFIVKSFKNKYFNGKIKLRRKIHDYNNNY